MKVRLTKDYEGANCTYPADTVIDLPSAIALRVLEAGTAVSVSVRAEAVAFDIGSEADVAALPQVKAGRSRRNRRNRS